MASILRYSIRKTIKSFKYNEYIQIVGYARVAHRKPVRVLTNKDINPNLTKEDKAISQNIINFLNEDNLTEENSTIKWRHAEETTTEPKPKIKANKRKTKSVKEPKQKENYDMLQTVIDGDGNINYTKMANNDTRISMLMTTVKSKLKKVKQNLILLEGKRLIKEALESGCRLKYLLFSQKDDLEYLKHCLPKMGASIYKMPLREMQLWSDLTTCPGIIGIFDEPTSVKPITTKNTVPVTVICDNIREPGNLGSILRTCAGVGCENVILTKGCVNLWDTKVTRSSCGGHFHLKIDTKVEWSNMKEKIKETSKIFMADNKFFTSTPDYFQNLKEMIQSIPLVPYYSVQLNKGEPIVLIIGGETEGLSEDAYKFVHDAAGTRLNIPLNDCMESLNAGVAIGVVLFEIRKQLTVESNIKENVL